MSSDRYAVPPPPAQWLSISPEEFYLELKTDPRFAPLFDSNPWLPIEWAGYCLHLCLWFRTHRYSRRGFA